MTVLVPAQTLLAYATEPLVDAGLPPPDAEVVAASLVEANTRGVDSHGVTRLPVYVERLRRGLVEPCPRVEVLRESGGTLLVDGGNGMGAVVTSRVLDLALARLRSHRCVSVAVRNTNHYGAGAYYAQRAVRHGAALFLYGNAPATMAPWGGARRFLGTNPFTFGVPAGRHDPLVLDMATSVVARGRIISAARRDEPIPSGWAVDQAGEPTTHAVDALAGSVLPFGGAKGYGIAVMVEVMAGVLAGANVGPDIGDLYEELETPQGLGSFLHLVDVSAFLPLDDFTRRVDALVDGLKSAGPGPGHREVMVPGEPEARTARERRRDGVPVPDDVVAALDALARPGRPRLSDLSSPTVAR